MSRQHSMFRSRKVAFSVAVRERPRQTEPPPQGSGFVRKTGPLPHRRSSERDFLNTISHDKCPNTAESAYVHQLDPCCTGIYSPLVQRLAKEIALGNGLIWTITTMY